MTRLVLDGLIGLLLGVALHLTGMDRADSVRETLHFRRRGEGKALLWASGVMAVTVSLLTWLAVIDVDDIPVLPLTGMTLVGGAICGLSWGLTGFTPETALSSAGGGRLTESLCALAGCAAGAYLTPYAKKLLSGTLAWFQPVEKTLFRFTLDDGYLLPGGYLAQGCIGLILLAAAVCVRHFRPPETVVPATPVTDPPSVEPEAVQEETVVVTLPGEEPVVVDTEEMQSDAQDTEEAAADTPGEDAEEQESSES
ncbi:MAG: YeeE/YedE family protein [Clostridia bacterium]|nr:YeeE/YedE family protein [Clostridia bacterium]